MRTWITSDLHLGSRFCQADLFLAFLEAMPPGTTLVLNGDSFDRMCHTLPDAHRKVLSRLRDESTRRTVIWVRGNHDEVRRLPETLDLPYQDHFNIPGLLHAEHGDHFAYESWLYRAGLRCFRAFHKLVVFCGAEILNVTFFAKRFPHLYEVLCRHVRTQAFHFAEQKGVRVAVCGHTHFAETARSGSIHYFNTGTWTEPDPGFVDVNDTEVTFHRFSATSAPEAPHDARIP
ncbi:MAG: hypothetical protein A2498_13870 [Lentisphaerae bacterium RIFOXYC12_FULL_60_16]|nr:MAG: hypothetical protein A2498_13870 [Lentisphaerae bacterium RIFOXYC12_FULL_60_16]OGV80386.1 MAG: hypothetical protein A2340_10280 [Lentisphaerae bacterium RIFOXYB12_FULL_60_10]